MHAESPRFSRYPYSAEKVAALVVSSLGNPSSIVLVAEIGERVVGFVGGVVTEHFFTPTKIAVDYALYIAPEARGGRLMIRLVREFERIAKQLDAAEFAPGVSTEVNAERVAMVYERLGYRLSGYIFRKDL